MSPCFVEQPVQTGHEFVLSKILLVIPSCIFRMEKGLLFIMKENADNASKFEVIFSWCA